MHSSTLVLLLLLWLVVTCHAYSAFKTECSIPSNSVNFVSSPDTRGTLDIVFSCVATIFACTWSIQHLNVPEQRVVTEFRWTLKGFWTEFKWTLKGLWSNLKWMLYTIVAPEFICGKAIGDFYGASLARDGMKRLAEFDGVEWGLEHSFYANIGGFVGSEQNNDDQAQGFPVTAYHIFLLRTTKAGTKQPLNVDEITAEGAQIMTYIEKLPNIRAAEIKDKSKGNVFVKAVTLFQVSWVVLQTIVRGAKGLSISPLELSVVAFSVCSIVTYLFLLCKPQGVQVPTPISLKPGSREILADYYHSLFPLRSFLIPGSVNEIRLDQTRTIPNDVICGYPDKGYYDTAVWGNDIAVLAVSVLGLMLGGCIFGSIHVAGWNLTFPTHIERTFWRISSILLTILLPITFLSNLLITIALPITFLSIYVLLMDSIDPLMKYIEDNVLGRSRLLQLLQLSSLLLGIVYFLARLFILIEIIRTLFSLPPDSYISTWTSNIPNVS